MTETYTDRFFESLHNAEFERKDHHDSIDGMLLTAHSVLGGVGIYFAKLIPDAYTHGGLSGWSFICLACIFGICVGTAAICVARSIWPPIIAYPGSPEEMRNFVEGLRVHYGHAENNELKVEEAIERDVIRVARSHYARCAAHNRAKNQEKTAWQSRSKVATSFAIGLLVLNAIPTFLVDRLHRDVQSVELINWPNQSQTAVEAKTDEQRP